MLCFKFEILHLHKLEPRYNTGTSSATINDMGDIENKTSQETCRIITSYLFYHETYLYHVICFTMWSIQQILLFQKHFLII